MISPVPPRCTWRDGALLFLSLTAFLSSVSMASDNGNQFMGEKEYQCEIDASIWGSGTQRILQGWERNWRKPLGDRDWHVREKHDSPYRFRLIANGFACNDFFDVTLSLPSHRNSVPTNEIGRHPNEYRVYPAQKLDFYLDISSCLNRYPLKTQVSIHVYALMTNDTLFHCNGIAKAWGTDSYDRRKWERSQLSSYRRGLYYEVWFCMKEIHQCVVQYIKRTRRGERERERLCERSGAAQGRIIVCW